MGSGNLSLLCTRLARLCVVRVKGIKRVREDILCTGQRRRGDSRQRPVHSMASRVF